MSKRRICAILLVALGFAGLAVPLARAEERSSPAPSTSTNKASVAQVDALVEDIDAHEQMCNGVSAAQARLYQQCTNEKAALVARQKLLGESDDALNGRLQSRGWRWP